MLPNEGPAPSLPAQLLHSITRRRHRVYGLIGGAFVLLAVTVWVYGGFETGIDFFTSVPRPAPPPPVPNHDASANHDAITATTHGAIDVMSGAHSSTAGAIPGPTQTETHANEHPVPDPPQETNPPTDDWRHSNHSPAASVTPGIPTKIWQILLPKKPDDRKWRADPKSLEDTASWLALNTDYTYTLVSQKGGEELVRNHFSSDPRIMQAYHNMPNVGMKSDLLRYLLLEAEGGVYTDTDTIALQPIDKWVPADLRGKVAVVVGIEFDRLDGVAWADINHWVQFCQWTIAAAPGHPLFRKMVDRIIASLDDLSALHKVPIQDLKPKSFEVMNSTGPAAFTDVVFEQLQEYNSSLKDTQDLSGMTEPQLIGDILVLPIDGFGMGQQHSHSTNDGTIPESALVKHRFNGGWRGGKRRRGEKWRA
ncbi:glycosyltransferase family 32 protein [Parathielavia appendiculata]|uniref:Glycosyltransferase family 32 protein n=1 Tax=Parathielavia appendiculata TaxID=2587402 RepID=A0AAN6Z850_9PEZI|nr:glycosyltransferase family 32 protein [Parathielavia appendiculata]